MKTGMELLKHFRAQAVREGRRGQEYHDGQAGGFRCCADELQAWLREVESFVTGELLEAGSGYGYEDGYNDAMNGIRQKLLGTTQKPKQEGEK